MTTDLARFLATLDTITAMMFVSLALQIGMLVILSRMRRSLSRMRSQNR